MSDNYTQDFIDEVKGALNSGSSGGGTIDQTARSDISNHVANSGVHVTVNDKTSWNNKAELSDIPTTLPASGGNADTVDGLHASDIQIDAVSDTAELATLDSLQGGVPFSSITVSGKNLITQVLSAALGGNSTDGFRITDNPYCRSFVRKLLPNTTYTVKRYDNGNRFRIILFNEYPTITADTTANQILNATTTPNEWTFTTGTDHLWFALTTHNGATDNTVAEPIVQLEYGDTATEYEEPIIGQEITLTVNDTEYTVTPDSNPYTVPVDIRQQDGINNVSVSAGEVSVTGVKKSPVINRAWEELDSHTNNTTVHVTAEEKALWNGKADRQSYAPIFSGDILDIPEMGTYSCHISNCSNLPSGIYDWGYVTMYNFNNSGYKRFICTPLDALGHSYFGKPNGMIYLASETYKDTDGNLIWSRACDGGDATTLESLPAKDFLQNLGTWSTGNIDDLILGANKSGIVWINTTVTGMPVEGKFWFGIIDCSNAHRCLRVTSQTDGQSFVRAYNSSTQYWYAWHNVSDGGNADTLDGKHASDFVLKSDYDALAARVAALEARTTE